MEEVTKTVNIATGVKDDIIQLQFYKNPIFIVFSLYVIIISGIYITMSDTIKNRFIFSNKFRDGSNGIHWLDIISYPYDFKKSVMNKLKIMLFSPIMIYLLFGIYLIINIIDPFQKRNQAYFYSVMFSFLFILILFTLHVIIFNFIISPESTNVELSLGAPEDRKKTYESFYRTQWVLLFALSPIIISIVVYSSRKMNAGNNLV
tara:strand:- start:99 stop:710 length:612 start_codon:yes stop_codon:yes gene_type:complete